MAQGIDCALDAQKKYLGSRRPGPNLLAATIETQPRAGLP